MPKARIHREGFQYTWFIVAHSASKHVPVLVGPNGKVILNEAVNRAGKIEDVIDNLMDAICSNDVDVRRVTRSEFLKISPKFPANSGKRKIAKRK